MNEILMAHIGKNFALAGVFARIRRVRKVFLASLGALLVLNFYCQNTVADNNTAREITADEFDQVSGIMRRGYKDEIVSQAFEKAKTDPKSFFSVRFAELARMEHELRWYTHFCDAIKDAQEANWEAARYELRESENAQHIDECRQSTEPRMADLLLVRAVVDWASGHFNESLIALKALYRLHRNYLYQVPWNEGSRIFYGLQEKKVDGPEPEKPAHRYLR